MSSLALLARPTASSEGVPVNTSVWTNKVPVYVAAAPTAIHAPTNSYVIGMMNMKRSRLAYSSESSCSSSISMDDQELCILSNLCWACASGDAWLCILCRLGDTGDRRHEDHMLVRDKLPVGIHQQDDTITMGTPIKTMMNRVE